MKLVFIFGDAAVGKMTTGQELMKITDLRLFHNHMTIEPVLEVFGTYNSRVVERLRDVFFEEFAKSDLYGMIFTYMFAFDLEGEWDYIKHVTDIFKGAEIYCVELIAPQNIRLERNKSENRLKHKPSKRDIETSDLRLLNDDNKYRFESRDGEVKFENYIKIDNSNLSAEFSAQIIKARFGL